MLEAEQVKETTELLATQCDALIRRVAAKDDEFAKERRAWKRRETDLLMQLRNARAAAKRRDEKPGDKHAR